MTYQEADIMFEKGNHWVLKVDYGFEVYKTTITHSIRCARIGFKGEQGLSRAIAEVERRESNI